MLTRKQLLLLTAMATLGGSFAGLLVVGMLAGDITLAMINLAFIVGLFCIVFIIGSSEKPAKKQRSGDIKVGGELLPEFKS
jgi:hypothetical protein